MEGGGGGGAGPNGTAPGTGNWPRQQRLKDLGSKLTGLQRMNHFAQLLVDEYAALLRKLVSFAWEDRYQQPWEDGFACGAQMLYGCGPFSEVLCEIEVQPRPTNVLRVPKTPPPRISDGEASGSHARHPRTDDGRNYAPSPDLRVNADTSKGHNTTPVEQKKPSITKGTPLKIGDHILQVKRIKKDRIELRSAYPGPNAQKAVTVTVMHQSRDFYDQQVGPWRRKRASTCFCRCMDSIWCCVHVFMRFSLVVVAPCRSFWPSLESSVHLFCLFNYLQHAASVGPFLLTYVNQSLTHFRQQPTL